ncbi:MAG: zinc ribbon domain-containing protein [Dehalococcoidia bacterium]|nr:zinc ribbon domain-containing protein [Dehalococcoidia bacterium]
MPLYEYRCHDCRRRSTVLVRSLSGSPEPTCEHCGSANLRRLISRVSFHRSWGDSLNWAPDSGYPDDMEHEDPRQMAQWMRSMQREMGEEVTPEFEQMMEEIESEAEMPDYGEE